MRGDGEVDRAGLLMRIARVRTIAERLGIPLCDRGRFKAMSDGALQAYYFNLSNSIKCRIFRENPEIARRWKFYDSMPVWEFIERVDQLRANRQERNSRLRP